MTTLKKLTTKDGLTTGRYFRQVEALVRWQARFEERE
jgi:hypothetical protein